MIGWGANFQVSGPGHRDPGPGDQVQVAGNLSSVICHLSSVIDPVIPRFRWQVLRPASSTQSSVIRHRFSHPFSDPFISGGRWQPQVAGGGCSALPHRLSHLSSVIDSVIHSVIHSALPEAARSARSADPTQERY